MGFRPKVHRLTFKEYEDADNPENSLCVDVTAPSVIEVLQMTAGRRDDEDGEQFTRRCLSYLAPRIKRWNVEDENGEPTPTTVEGLINTDEDVVLAILKRWRSLSETEPAASPLGNSSAPTSTAGPTSVPVAQNLEMEHSIPMK
jgi:hypothetical protein